jgi:hypothetical protein
MDYTYNTIPHHDPLGHAGKHKISKHGKMDYTPTTPPLPTSARGQAQEHHHPLAQAGKHKIFKPDKMDYTYNSTTSH